jgi:hypothetical protein
MRFRREEKNIFQYSRRWSNTFFLLRTTKKADDSVNAYATVYAPI